MYLLEPLFISENHNSYAFEIGQIRLTAQDTSFNRLFLFLLLGFLFHVFCLHHFPLLLFAFLLIFSGFLLFLLHLTHEFLLHGFHAGKLAGHLVAVTGAPTSQ